MKKRLLFLLAAVVLVCLLTAVASADGKSGKTVLMPNTPFADRLKTENSKNQYTVTLPSAGMVTISFSHAAVEQSYAAWNIAMKFDSGSECLYLSSSENTAGKTSCRQGLPAGTYQIEVTPAYNYQGHIFWSGAEYRIQVNFTASNDWETEQNNSRDTADEITTGRTIHGTVRDRVSSYIQDVMDYDYYRFTLSEPGYISVSFSHDAVTDSSATGVFWRLSLSTADKQSIIYEKYLKDETEEDTSAVVGIPAGVYYICIQNNRELYVTTWNFSAAEYRFRVNYTQSTSWETEPNDTIETAQGISTGERYHGTIYRNMDYKFKDYFRFTLPEATDVSVSFSHDYVDSSENLWKLAIIDAAENEYLSELFKGNEKEEIKTQKVHLYAGTYYIFLTMGDKMNSAPYAFRINVPVDISGCTISDIPDQIYTGRKITPKITVKDGTETLTSGTDFTVSYANNKSIGTATVTVTGTGDYVGTKSAEFRINPKGVKLSSVKAGSKMLTVKWAKGKAIDGYEVQYSLKKSFKSAKTVTIKKASTTKTEITKLKAKKNYYVRVRVYKKVGGKKYVSAWSNVKSAKTKK